VSKDEKRYFLTIVHPKQKRSIVSEWWHVCSTEVRD